MGERAGTGLSRCGHFGVTPGFSASEGGFPTPISLYAPQPGPPHPSCTSFVCDAAGWPGQGLSVYCHVPAAWELGSSLAAPALSMQGPQCSHFVRVLWLWCIPVCPFVPVRLCLYLSVCTFHCVRPGLCHSSCPWCWALGYPGGGGDAAQPLINVCLSDSCDCRPASVLRQPLPDTHPDLTNPLRSTPLSTHTLLICPKDSNQPSRLTTACQSILLGAQREFATGSQVRPASHSGYCFWGESRGPYRVEGPDQDCPLPCRLGSDSYFPLRSKNQTFGGLEQ